MLYLNGTNSNCQYIRTTTRIRILHYTHDDSLEHSSCLLGVKIPSHTIFGKVGHVKRAFSLLLLLEIHKSACEGGEGDHSMKLIIILNLVVQLKGLIGQIRRYHTIPPW